MSQISVIVPVYNSEKYVAEAIQSVLAQTYQHFEIIVIDDGSTDGSAAVVQTLFPSVTYIFQENQGVGSARNKGIDNASGDYFALLDADDIWLEDKLARQIAVFDQDPQVDLVYGHVRQFYSPELIGQIEKEVKIPREVMPAQLSSSMLIKRDSFFKVGHYETKWTVSIDQEWHLRTIDRALNIVMLPDIVYWRRIHNNNLGRRKKKLNYQRLHVLKESIDRRNKNKSG